MKINLGIVIVIISIIIIAGLAWGVSTGVGGNKVTVRGTVYFNMITGWGITCDGYLVKEDSFIGSALWYFPWETKDINVVVEMDNGKTYSAESWAGKMNLILGSTTFSTDVRHVPTGSYTGVIYLYEVEKGLLWGETTRVLQASTNFRVNV